MTAPQEANEDEDSVQPLLPQPLLPQRLLREQQALGIILSLISRSLAICVGAIAVYLAWSAW